LGFDALVSAPREWTGLPRHRRGHHRGIGREAAPVGCAQAAKGTSRSCALCATQEDQSEQRLTIVCRNASVVSCCADGELRHCSPRNSGDTPDIKYDAKVSLRALSDYSIYRFVAYGHAFLPLVTMSGPGIHFHRQYKQPNLQLQSHPAT
jgi:hypothetical protein